MRVNWIINTAGDALGRMDASPGLTGLAPFFRRCAGIAKRSVLVVIFSIVAGNAYAVPGLQDWDVVTWPGGSTGPNSYPVTGGNITIQQTGATNRFLLNTPEINTIDTGGTGERVLDHFLQFSNTGETITITISFDHTVGVSNVQFNLYDIDTGANFIDQAVVTATDTSSNALNPASITTSGCNTQVNANTVQGTCTSPNNGTAGNVTFTFDQVAIQQITIVYSNQAVTTTPGTQAITLHDISFDYPQVNLSVIKDDGALIYTPGGTSSYTLTVNNSGPDDAVNALVSDTLPAGVSINGSWSCTPSGSASCISGSVSALASGTGNINQQVDIPAGSSVVFTVPVSFSSDPGAY